MSQTLQCGIEVSGEQAAVISHLLAHPMTVVGAGAGSGKTYTMVAAILELIELGRAQADEFILITFTNKAADELRQRLLRALDLRCAAVAPQRRGFWLEQQERLSAAFIGTIHGFCRNLLTDYGYAQEVAREASVSFSNGRLSAAIESVVEELAASPDAASPLSPANAWPEYELRRRLQTLYLAARSQGLDVGELLEDTRRQPHDPGRPYRIRMAELLLAVHRTYEAACQQSQKLDAAALLLKTADLLEGPEGQRVAVQLARRFSRLFIDEFQDTSGTQIRIVDVLRHHLSGVLLVGDRKQAIYAFAGADVSLIDRFASACGLGRPLPLRLTGRPTLPLLNVQNVLFSEMRQRFKMLDDPLEPRPGVILPDDQFPPLVVLRAPGDAPDRLDRLARRIANLIGTPNGAARQLGGKFHAGHIAILTRTNAEVKACVASLTAAGIDARDDSGTPFFRRPEVVATYRFLNLLVRWPDDGALIEALTTPHLATVDLSDREAELLTYGHERGTPLTDALEQRYPALLKTLQELLKAARIATVPQLLGLVEKGFQLKAGYHAASNPDAALSLDRLRDHARSLFSHDEALTLRTFVSALRRDIETDRDLRETGPSEGTVGYVRVLTIHRAKGLEFPVVVIPEIHIDRMGNGTPPFLMVQGYGLDINVQGVAGGTYSPDFWHHLNAMKRHSLEEEMRLFYVAVTRAQHMLILFGDDADQPRHLVWNGEYSWQDEILYAKAELRRAGARFQRT